MQQTPLDAYTVVDVMRNTLGVGPCEYILDLEGQKAEYKGRATCSVRDELGAIYGKGQQKQQRAKVEKVLDEQKVRILGMDTTPGSGWMVIDAFEVMVHLFTVENRDKYRMELLWKERANEQTLPTGSVPHQ